MTSDEGSDEEYFPNEKEAITIDVPEGITSEECTIAIGKLIGASNIHFASEKITDGKMYLYLKSQESVRKLLDNHKHVNIGNQTLELQPLLHRFKLFTISNISPTVPHCIIEAKLSEINVSYTAIDFTKVHIEEPGYNHIRSFQRCAWIKAEDVNKLTNATQIKFENTIYRIRWQEKQYLDLYLKEIIIGKQILSAFEESYLAVRRALVLPSGETFLDKLNLQENQGLNKEKKNLKPPNVSGKRALSPSASSSSNSDPITQDNQLLSSQNSDTQTPNKKILTETFISRIAIDKQIEKAKQHIGDQAGNFPLSFDLLSRFLFEAYGQPEIKGIAQKFTNDFPALAHMLKCVEPHLTKKKLKKCLKKIVKEVCRNG